MGDILGQVERWRLYAVELRTQAESLSNAVAKDAMLEMADSYDKLADRMKKLAVKQPRSA